jgi:hypothetical protein
VIERAFFVAGERVDDLRTTWQRKAQPRLSNRAVTRDV